MAKSYYIATTASSSTKIDWGTIAPTIHLKKEKSMANAKTQKGKGLLFLTSREGLQTDIIPVSAPRDTGIGGNVFVRACPVTPRHGVLESKMCKEGTATKFIAKLAKDMIKAGELEGEIAVQAYIDAVSNIVWGPGMIVAAPDNDGVTAGKHPQLAIRMEAPTVLTKAIEVLGLDEAEIEIVSNATSTFITQVRAATGHFNVDPAPVGSFSGFSDKPIFWNKCDVVMVKGIDDMIALEAFEKKDKDVVVIHFGGNIASHASAWSRQKGYAYLALPNKYNIHDLKPCLTQVANGWLVPSDEPIEADAVAEIDWFATDFFDGMEYARLSKFAPSDVMSLSMFFNHYASGMSSSKELAFVAGCFSGMLIRLTLAIAAGEARHLQSTYRSSGEWGDWFEKSRTGHRGYEKYTHAKMTLVSIDTVLKFLYGVFHHPKWQSSYGGDRWAGVVAGAIRVLKTQGKKDLKECLIKTNTLLNVVHNGGWAFNKVSSQDALNLWKPDKYKKNVVAVGSAFRLAIEILQKKLTKATSIISFKGPIPKNPNWEEKPINYDEVYTINGVGEESLPKPDLSALELIAKYDYSSSFDPGWGMLYVDGCTCDTCLAWLQNKKSKEPKPVEADDIEEVTAAITGLNAPICKDLPRYKAQIDNEVSVLMDTIKEVSDG